MKRISLLNFFGINIRVFIYLLHKSEDTCIKCNKNYSKSVKEKKNCNRNKKRNQTLNLKFKNHCKVQKNTNKIITTKSNDNGI